MLPSLSKVHELMQENERTWNEDLIDIEFGKDDADCIKSIAIRAPKGPDALEWHYGRKGRFSIHITYELCLQHLVEASTSSSHAQGKNPRVGWQFLWQAKVPPRVKLLAWRACQEAIPACYNIKRRGLNISTSCIRCGQELDDVLHVMLRCSFSRQVWELSSLPWRWINFDVSSSED
ncbi:UNVERIFIED_CONTAM: hypothetical protein Slati_2969300 [Sesamum latifolium]|uniref:Reverse transcriptase zinc-binding domain-containing protein n=1 Tax=Sesamum latifolium TaxID=2727402 RepID=A0AAW2VEY4_9LAMI